MARCQYGSGHGEIFDAAIQPGPGTVTVETVMPGQQYRITLTVDEAFLTDPNTVYPVTIDPTLTVSDNTHGAGAIEDAPIYEGYPTSNFGSYQYNRAGYAGTAYKRGRTVVRLRRMLLDGFYRQLTSEQINSVKFYMADATGTSGATVEIHPLNSYYSWTENGITWNTATGYEAAVWATSTPAGGAFGEFDITNLVKVWKGGLLREGQGGFVMIGANEASVDKSLYSSEHTTTAKRPYVVLTWSDRTFYYKNYYDATVSGNSWFHSGVSYAVETADGAFSRLFPVRFYAVGSAERRTDAYPETCNAGVNSPCTTSSCTADCRGKHHKNADHVGEQILSWPRPDNTISVLWTNYARGIYCRFYDNQGHSPISSYATTNILSSPAILVMNIDGSTTAYKKAFMAYLLTHETVHSFGMPDVYTEPSDDQDGGENKPVGHDVVGWKCMMEYHEPEKMDLLVAFCEAVRQGKIDAFCTSCMGALQNNYVPGAYFEGNQ